MQRIKRIEPGPGQESVWDYPRPPRLEDSTKHIQVIFNGVMIADTRNAKRVLETSHPPTYYLPPENVQMGYFTPTNHRSFCEWKGAASYYTLTVDDQTIENVAWYYVNPVPSFASLKDYLAIYPGKMDVCYIDGERVQTQEGDFYGGWITSDIVGPFKGGAGTWGW
ncbi:MAG: hypothetical protein GFH27_549327n50 [Chloroflexi bacterium AL-W]|nr:hypothetical protein [Chloroflexi bacterium AL-N1]NOK69662.1 hypothetical protein [Chloroflexi bacterium AL-N10]NOK72209.1 hypothetical protein [Chloroflexi bacterium AL-N5]NOK85038.1 hypothetical protein [Chloroflexi bacterium AL-W]NOK91791.1 hypothetical protein [Chloroflexi bacterium AL-N15]